MKDNPVHTLELPRPHSKEQRIIMKAFVTPGLREVWCPCGSKFGKAYSLQEVTPTTDGYKTLADLKVGDYVFDEHGKPTKVLHITDTMYNHDCYDVVFSDGNKVVADKEHLWVTETHCERKNKARVLNKNDRTKSTNSKPTARTTKEILDTLHIMMKGKPRPNHSIPLVSSPVQFPKQQLPIDPYTLGIWLGDGNANGGLITINNKHHEILREIETRGHIVRKVPSTELGYRIEGFTSLLRKNNLLGNKHVPAKYLIGSPKQRLDLLRGLLDSDATISKRGDCTFDNTNKNLADNVEQLAMSLGIKCTRDQRIGKLYGVEKKLCYRVYFTTDIPVFNVKAKLDRIRPVALKAKKRYIVEVNPVPSVPVKCIRVANPTHLFLVGRACIPTHNSIGWAAAMAKGAWIKPGAFFRWVAPIYKQAKIGLKYHQALFPTEYYELNKSEPSITLKNKARIEYTSGKFPEDLEGEGVTGGYCFDEAAKMPRQIYDSARTTVTITKALLGFFSTPKGKNWFYDGYREAKNDMEWCIKNGKAPTKIAITAPSIANPYVSQEEIERNKRDLPDRLFRQYYLAEFLDDGSVFIGFRDCLYTDPIDLTGSIHEWYDVEANEKEVVLGVDWAKKHDFTVMGAVSYQDDIPKLIGYCRFQGLSYIEAIKQLIRFTKKFKQVRLIRHDKTGVGEAIDDMLAQTSLPYEGIIFTNASKSTMVSDLMLCFERGDLLLPNIQNLIYELDIYEVQTNALGTAKYSAPLGSHDDIVSMLMLAYSAVKEYRAEFKIRFLEDLPKEKFTIDRWYNELQEEEYD